MEQKHLSDGNRVAQIMGFGRPEAWPLTRSAAEIARRSGLNGKAGENVAPTEECP